MTVLHGRGIELNDYRYNNSHGIINEHYNCIADCKRVSIREKGIVGSVKRFKNQEQIYDGRKRVNKKMPCTVMCLTKSITFLLTFSLVINIQSLQK